MSDDDVSVKARFERFPATIKGAFVVHGEDANPHQVALIEARVASLGPSAGTKLPMPSALVNVPPRQDMFVPFEFSVAELGPGWYELVCDIAVDGAPRTVTGGRRFLVNWPRTTTRRGPVDVRGELGSGDSVVALESMECSTDRSTLRYSAAELATLRVSADGQRLPELSASFQEGKGVVECYPLLRSNSALRIELAGRASEALDVHLP